MRKIAFILFGVFVLSATHAEAAGKLGGPRALGTFDNWTAYEVTERGQPVCYMTLTLHFPNNTKLHRGDALLTITHRPAENSKDVISYSPGYNYKPMSSSSLVIGHNRFDLFTSQDTAWSRDAATDHKIATAIRTSPLMTVTSTPANKGVSAFTDKLVLKGASQAYQAIGKACHVGS